MASFLLWAGVVTGLLAAGTLYQRFGEAREAARSKPPGAMVDIGGRRLHMLRSGTGGPAIVMEAGGAGSSSIWWPLQDRLAEHSTVVTYDRAGLGWSDYAALPRTIEDRATDLHLLLTAARIPPPYVLVGLSYGGPVIRVFALRHPEMVAGLVFVDIAHEAVFAEPAAQKYLRRSAMLLRAIGRLSRVGLLRVLRIRGSTQPATALPFNAAQRAALESRFPTARSFLTGADEFESMLRIGEAMAGTPGAGSLGMMPIAVISHGKPFPGPFAVLETHHLEGQRRLAALSGNSLFVVARDSSHGVPVEEPQVVIDSVLHVWRAAAEASD